MFLAWHQSSGCLELNLDIAHSKNLPLPSISGCYVWCMWLELARLLVCCPPCRQLQTLKLVFLPWNLLEIISAMYPSRKSHDPVYIHTNLNYFQEIPFLKRGCFVSFTMLKSIDSEITEYIRFISYLSSMLITALIWWCRTFPYHFISDN